MNDLPNGDFHTFKIQNKNCNNYLFTTSTSSSAEGSMLLASGLGTCGDVWYDGPDACLLATGLDEAFG